MGRRDHQSTMPTEEQLQDEPEQAPPTPDPEPKKRGPRPKLSKRDAANLIYSTLGRLEDGVSADDVLALVAAMR